MNSNLSEGVPPGQGGQDRRPLSKPRTQNSGRAPRWQWYHYYFVLALLDVFVIVASVLMIHSTTKSYEIALQKLASTHARQRWIANLRLKVINLNAPGNDVFESRRIAEERASFESQSALLEDILRRQNDLEFELTEFRGHLGRMMEAESRVFELMKAAEQAPELLEEASRSMAAMDRHQTAAITALTELEQTFLMRVESLLREHGARIQRYASLELSFVALIGIVLLGMFWYGRKLHDLHEEMMLQNRRAENERMARLAAVGEVCAAVAHGIRNPLAAISSSAQLTLATEKSSPNIRSRIEDILVECRRLNERVTQLLAFASSSVKPGLTFRLKDAIDQAATELAPRFREKSVSVETSYRMDPWIEGNRELFVQCTIELLSNAFDYSPGGGRITLDCHPSKQRRGFVDLIVTDQGPGIPSNVSDKVFDLFFTTRPGGTGVGLASVKHTIHHLGGEVSIDPEFRNGACIRVTLPLAGPGAAVT